MMIHKSKGGKGGLFESGSRRGGLEIESLKTQLGEIRSNVPKDKDVATVKGLVAAAMGRDTEALFPSQSNKTKTSGELFLKQVESGPGNETLKKLAEEDDLNHYGNLYNEIKEFKKRLSEAQLLLKHGMQRGTDEETLAKYRKGIEVYEGELKKAEEMRDSETVRLRRAMEKSKQGEESKVKPGAVELAAKSAEIAKEAKVVKTQAEAGVQAVKNIGGEKENVETAERAGGELLKNLEEEKRKLDSKLPVLISRLNRAKEGDKTSALQEFNTTFNKWKKITGEIFGFGKKPEQAGDKKPEIKSTKPATKAEGVSAPAKQEIKQKESAKKYEKTLKAGLSEADISTMRKKIKYYGEQLRVAKNKNDKESADRLEKMIEETEVNIYDLVEIGGVSSEARAKETKEAKKQEKIMSGGERGPGAGKPDGGGEGPKKPKIESAEEMQKQWMEAENNLLQAEKEYNDAKKKGERFLDVKEEKYERAKFAYNNMIGKYGHQRLLSKIELLKSSGINSSHPEYQKEMDLFKADLYKTMVIDAQDALAAARFKNMEPKKQGLFQKMIKGFAKMPKWKRYALTGAVAFGLSVATGGLAAGGVAAAVLGGQRAVSAIAGVAVAGWVFKGVNALGGRKVEKYFKDEEKKLEESFALRAEQALDRGAPEKDIFELQKESAEKRAKLIEEVNKKYKNIGRWALGASIATGIAVGGGVNMVMNGMGLESAVQAKIEALRQTAQSKTEVLSQVAETKVGAMATGTIELPIGARGPEGSMIDHFTSNPDAAKSFGIDMNNVGRDVHRLWLSQVGEALQNLDTIKQLTDTGLSVDANGLMELSRRIGKGVVELNFGEQSFGLSGVEYVKGAIGETVSQVAGAVGEQLPGGSTLADVVANVPGATEYFGDALEKAQELISLGVNLETAGKLQDIFADLSYASKNVLTEHIIINPEDTQTFLDFTMDKFFQPTVAGQAMPDSAFLEFGQKLQELSQHSNLANSGLTVKDVIEAYAK